MKRYYFFFIISCVHTLGWTQDSIIVFDRPGIAESPYIVDVQRWQIETGVGYAEFSGISEAVLPSLLLRKYIFKNTELRYAFNYEPQMLAIIKENIKSDFDPMALGIKTKLCKEKGIRPESSFLLNTYFPMQLIGKKNTSGTFNLETGFQCHNNFNETFGLNYNIGTIFSNIDTKGIIYYSSCLNIKVADNLGLFVETFGYVPLQKKLELGFDIGIVYNPNRNSQIDISIIDNIEFQNHYASVLIGYSIFFY